MGQRTELTNGKSHSTVDTVDYDTLLGKGVTKTHGKWHSSYNSNDQSTYETKVYTNLVDGGQYSHTKTHRDGSSLAWAKSSGSYYSEGTTFGIYESKENNTGHGKSTFTENWHEHTKEGYGITGSSVVMSKVHHGEQRVTWSKGTTHDHSKYSITMPMGKSASTYFYSSTEDTTYTRGSTTGSKFTVASKVVTNPGMNPAITSNRTDWTTSGSNDTTVHTDTSNYTGLATPTITVTTTGDTFPVLTTVVVSPTITSGGGYTWSGWWDSWDDSPFMAGLEAGAKEFARGVKSAALQIFVGEWSGENSVAGAIGSVLFGLTGLDIYKDVLDFSYHIAHFDPTDWHSYADVGLDVVGMIPVLGAVKNVVKGVSKTGDALKSGAKAAEALDDATDATKAAAKAGDAAKQAEHAKDTAKCSDDIRCFTRDTLVATESGSRPIGEINPGDSVYAFDFDLGVWVTSLVLERHDNNYDGPIVTIETADGTINATVYHPFWVVDGRDLSERPEPRELAPSEDQGKALYGRWVNSHDLRAGDVIYGLKNERITVCEVSQTYHDIVPVSNLTVSGTRNYAVGGVCCLVHNTSVCEGALDAEGSLRETAKSIHSLAHPVKLKNQTIAIAEVRLADGTRTFYAAANSSAGLAKSQLSVLKNLGVNVATMRGTLHVEQNIAQSLPVGAVVTRWGISKGKWQLALPCREKCQGMVMALGGIIE